MRTVDISKTARRLGAIRGYNALFFLTCITAFSHVVADSVAMKGDISDVVTVAALIPIAWVLWASADPVAVVKTKWLIPTYAYTVILCLLAVLLTALVGSATGSILQIVYSVWFLVLLLVAARALLSARRFRSDEIGNLGFTAARFIDKDEGAHLFAKITRDRRVLTSSLIMIAAAVVLLLLRAYLEDALTTQMEGVNWRNVGQTHSNSGESLSHLEEPLLLAAIYLILKARATLQPSAETLLSTDHRPATLYLRSFSDDEKLRVMRMSQYSISDFSLEGRLAGHLGAEGPFIAVGSPDHETPPAGAARAYLTDGEWQGRVSEWMKSARLIILAAGTTQWVEWELKQIVDLGYTDKLVVLIPEKRFVKKTVPVRLAKVSAAFVATKWEVDLRGLTERKDVRALTFGRQGEVTAILGTRGSRDECQLAALVGEYLVACRPREVRTAETSEAAPEGQFAPSAI